MRYLTRPLACNRRLRCLLAAILASTLLAGCGGGGGGGSGGNNNTTTTPPPPPAAEELNLIISGVVTDEPIANAELVVRIGTDEFTTTADALGAYEISIRLVEGDYDPDALVEIYARGVDAQSEVELITIAGSVAGLLEAAGDDDTLTADENSRLNVTHISTARYLLSLDRNGGIPPANLAELEATEAATDVSALLELAAIIKLIVDEGLVDVPEGETTASILRDSTGSEFVSDTVERLLIENGLLDEAGTPISTYREALANAVRATLVDSGFGRSINGESLHGLSVWASPSIEGWVPYSGEVFDFEADGSGVAFVAGRLQDIDPGDLDFISKPFTWTEEDGVVDLRFDDYVTYSFPSFSVPSIYEILVEESGFDVEVVAFIEANRQGLPANQISLETTVVGQEVTVISDDAERPQVWVIESREHRIDDTLLQLGWQGELPVGRTTRSFGTQVILDADTQVSGVTLPAAGDTLAVLQIYSVDDPLLTAPDPARIQHDVFTLLGNGSTSPGEFGAEPQQWTVNGSSLTLQSGNESWTYTPISTDGDVIFALMAYRLDGIIQLRTAAWMASDNGSGSTFASNLVQDFPVVWLSGNNQQPAAFYLPDGRLDPHYIFGYDFMDATNLQRLFSDDFRDDCFDGAAQECFVPEGYPWTWATEGNDRIRLVSDATLGIPRNRIWRVLRHSPDVRAVIVEVDFISFSPGEWSVLIAPRINTMELSDLRTWPETFDESKFEP